MLLVCRFTPTDPDAFLAAAHTALTLLGAQPGCRGGELGRAVDDPTRWVLCLRFDSVPAYRRALSPFAVREHVVPWLAQADPEPATFEARLTATDGQVTEHPSLLA